MKRVNFKPNCSWTRLTAMILLLFTIGVGQMGADSTVKGGNIYFDELNSGYSGAGDMQFWVGHSGYSSSYTMSKITNTKLWYCSAPSWGDATYFAFTSGANWGAASQDYYTRIGSNTWKSAKKESYTVNSGSYYVFKAASTANKAAVGSDSPYGYKGTAASSLNSTQTFKVQVTTNGGSSYSNPATAPASLSYTSNTFGSATACSTSSTGSITVGNSTVSVNKSAGFTAKTDITYSSMSSDYTFVCWHDGSSNVGTGTTYTYYPTGAKTITARFTRNYIVGSVLYLKPNASWKSDGARFAAYFIGTGSTTWVDCARVGESDYWSVTVPAGNWGYVIFCRMDGSTATNNWDNEWNQTDDLMYDSSHNGVEITGWDNSQNRISVATATITGTYHYFPGETISLTAIPMGNGSTTPTYQWYHGGTGNDKAISGATSATYTKASCAYGDMGAYYCKVSWGGNSYWADGGTAYNLKMLRLWVNGSRNGEPYGNVDFTKIDGTTAEATINLGLLWTYGFSIGDGCGNYYGNTGTMTASNHDNWTMNSSVQCELTTTNAADYTFTVNYSNLAAPVVSVAFPEGNQAASKTIYFDNNVLKWANVWYRIGRVDHSQATQMTKVYGTDNLYKVTTTKYDNFSSWFVANAQGGTGSSKSIYNTKNTPAITAATAYRGNAVTATSVTVTPGEDHSTGGTSENINCEFYSYTIANNMKTDAVTISPYTNGTITVNYVNTSNVASNFTSGTQNLAHTVILTSITAVANTGYDASAITINGGAYSANYVVTGATTIAASFTPHVYSITYLDQGGAAFSGTHESGYPTTHTYNTATTLKSASKTGYTFGGWYTNSACTGDAVTSLGATAYTADITLYAKWTPVRLYFVTAGNWNNENNWSPKCVPTIEHDVTIQAPCVVNINRAQAKSIIIDKYSGSTGKLTIGANKGLEVTGTIQLKNAGGSLVATTPEDLVLESAAAGNASLIFNNSNSCQATVYMYSKAVGTGSTWNWQYVGTPFTGTKASPNYNGSYLYHWNSASSTWEPVSNDDNMVPFTGYCITQSSATVLEMTGTLNASSDQEITIPANSSCVVANSWTGPIFIRQLQDADFGSMEKTIYLFNTGNDKDKNHGEGTSAGTYRAVPIHSSPYVRDSVISSMQGFFVKNSTGSSQTLRLSYDDHVRPARATDDIRNGAMYAPKRIQTAEPEVMKVIVQSNKGGATLYLLAREDFTRGYDDGWDGENINEAGAAPLLNSPREDGTKDAVSAIPAFEGAAVGFMTGEEDEYTFSFDYNGFGKWYLNDLKAETSTRIKAQNTYTFHPTGNDMKRFIISATPLGMVAASEPVASVLVEGYPEQEFENFDEAWSAAMNGTDVTIKLLADLERTESIVYSPTVDNAQHVLDLNNHTITENTSDRLLIVNKAGAKLTITDNSAEGKGCLYKKMANMEDIYTVLVIHGEAEMAGGKLYCENTEDNLEWNPAITLCSKNFEDAVITVSGGEIEAVSLSAAYGVCGYGPVTITDGHIHATVNKYSNARALCQVLNTANVYGGTLEAKAIGSGSGCYAVVATGWVGEEVSDKGNAIVNIHGGTFHVEGLKHTICCVQSSAQVKQIGAEILTAQGIINISGGDFSAQSNTSEASQVTGGMASAVRLFDEQTPHHLLGESLGELNISGGTFLVDARDGEKYVANGNNIDILRSWGKLNVTGGDFTIYQNTNAAAIGVYRNKTTVSGNPVFHVHCATGARGIVAAPWNSADYCDADAANNLAEIEVSGGTFYVTAEKEDVIGVWASGSISEAGTSGTGIPGYAMSGKITIHDGEFICSAPSSVRMLQQKPSVTGEYGTATHSLIVNGGRFRMQQETGVGINIDAGTAQLTDLRGGLFTHYAQLAEHINDAYTIVHLTDADAGFAEGYRYTIGEGTMVANVTDGTNEKSFAMLQTAMRYAKKQPQALITLIDDVNFYGPYALAPDAENNQITLDLNNHRITGYSYGNRFFTKQKEDAQLTITDNSDAKGGVWNFEMPYDAGSFFNAIVIDHGELELAGGKLHVKNTHAGNGTIGINLEGQNTKFTQTGGAIEVQSTDATANGIYGYGAVEINGGSITVQTTGNPARALWITSSEGVKYGSLKVSGSPIISVFGSSNVSGVYSNSAGTSIQIDGGEFFVVSNGRVAYGICMLAAVNTIISAGTFHVSSFGAHCRAIHIQDADAQLSVTGGSFEVNALNSGDGVDNIEGIRMENGGLCEISGGTFTVTNSSEESSFALCVLAGAMTISEDATFVADYATRVDAGALTVKGGRFNCPSNMADAPAGTLNLTGGYYVSDEQLADYCTFPYEVLPTTDADKERVGEIYAYKISDESSERGIRLDIVDYTPSSMTLNMNGFRTDEEPPYGWEVEVFGKSYRSEDCAANKTLTLMLPEPVEPAERFRIIVRSQGGTIESARFYTMPYIFESDATLPEGDYSASVLYVRSGTLTIDREVQASKVIICPEAELDVTDGLLTADTIVLRGLPNQSALIYGSFTVDKLYFTRIGPDGSESYPATKYHPFALPLGYGSPVKDVRLSNGTTPTYGTSWVLRRNVGETEVKLTIDDIVESGKEYELFSSLPYYREYYFPLAPSTTDIPSLTDNSSKARKVLVDGQLFIVTADGIYDVMGKRR